MAVVPFFVPRAPAPRSFLGLYKRFASAFDPQNRAELVAGLRVVDYVSEFANSLTPHIHLEAEDEQRFAALLKHVQARQKGKC